MIETHEKPDGLAGRLCTVGKQRHKEWSPGRFLKLEQPLEPKSSYFGKLEHRDQARNNKSTYGGLIMYVGIDVSKAGLDVKSTTWDKPERYANSKGGISNLVKRLDGAVLVVMEATGGYERTVAKALHESGVKTAVMNPRRTHHFAKTMGKKAKTDKIDAVLLSEFAEKIQPEPTKVLTDEEFELRQLIIRRIQLMNQKTQEKNRLDHATAIIAKSIRYMIKRLKAQIKDITKQIEGHITKDASLSERAKLLQSAQGVGEITAYSLCALLPELGQLNRKEIAALVGVAPFNRDSGNESKIRSIHGGRKEIRTALYMATLTAIRCNTKIKAFFIKLLAKGKKKKVALVACMRKFLVCLNAMVKTKELWHQPIK